MALPLASQTVVLNDGSRATIHPVWDGSQLPLELVAALCVEYNAEVDRGRSFPETQRMMLENFEKSWFAGVAGVMIRGEDASRSSLEDFDLLDSNECLGSFWIQPCFPGRSSHICTANILVKSRFRNHGVGKAMGQCFLRWALQLGYDYALFTLVYDCNIAACKILDKLGFSVLSVLKGAGILKGFSHPVDAFMFGRSLVSRSGMTPGRTPVASGMTPGMTPPAVQSKPPQTPPQQWIEQQPSHQPIESEEEDDPPVTPRDGGFLSEEFEHVRQYLLSGIYPEESNRTERTRIRSRARSYEVADGVLLFKRTQKPVVTDEKEQIRITTRMHRKNHSGINKMQKQILAAYYWNGVRETIARVIRNCPECRSNHRQQPQPAQPAQHASLTEQAQKAQKAQQVQQAQKAQDQQAQQVRQAQLQLHEQAEEERWRRHQEQTQGNSSSSSSSSSQAAASELNHMLFTESLPQHDQDKLDSQMLDTYFATNDLNSIVYLPPENEDDEYVPDNGDDNVHGVTPSFEGDGEDDDDSLFMDEDDDEEWTSGIQDEEDDDEDEDEEDEDNEEEE